jgi:hypothetical protein
MNVPWSPQPQQETWPRRRIEVKDLPWGQQWNDNLRDLWTQINLPFQVPMRSHHHGHSVFWLDLPGFDCAVHIDGSLPGALQMYWVGEPDLGTCFYHDSAGTQVRKHFDFISNTGYIMANPDNNAEFTGLFHGTPNSVPKGKFRVTSYTLLTPI